MKRIAVAAFAAVIAGLVALAHAAVIPMTNPSSQNATRMGTSITGFECVY